ncbi:MAG TPA: hypothetical protein EYN04_02500 [Porticoccaceae bacterium]|nr:hypothetical protein [Porticoccaceae bacterium]
MHPRPLDSESCQCHRPHTNFHNQSVVWPGKLQRLFFASLTP